MRNKLYSIVLIVLLTLTGCATPHPQPLVDSNPASANPTVAPVLPTSDSASTKSQPDAPHMDVLDVAHLTLGDNKISSTPQRGYVYSCMTQFNGGGAQGTGTWMNGDGTWDLTKKISVDGSVTWPHSFTITAQGDQRLFSSNDLPDHPTGNFPISPNDDAYQVDRNPNSIQGQSFQFKVPTNPTVAVQPTCVGGEVGILLSGVLLFSSFDAEGRDAVAHEVQDQCDGHPQESGYYHYHSLSPCIPDTSTGQSALMGYAFDGFGIYGPYGADGKELTNADLDECHGITSEVEWDGQKVTIYHYVATREFPYVVGCFRGKPSVITLTSPDRGSGQQPSGQGGQGRQPPQPAIDACTNLSQDSACSFNTPNGQVNGTCNLPPNSNQLACMPAGGPP